MRNFEALTAYLADRQTMPFAWGSNDCVTFAAGAVQALTGRDPLDGVAKWKTERSALARLNRLGGLEAAVSGILATVPCACAHRGDIGLIQTDIGPALVIITGVTLIGPGPSGAQIFPRQHLQHAWSVG